VRIEEHEAGIAAFLTPRHAARWRTVGARHDDLSHFSARLDPARSELLAGPAADDAAVVARLAAEGAPDRCVAVAESLGWGVEMALAVGVEALAWPGGGFLSCVPGRLGLYVAEFHTEVFLLRRS
jgi:hypothetical protein